MCFVMPKPEFVTAACGRDVCYAWKMAYKDVEVYGESVEEVKECFIKAAQQEEVLLSTMGRLFCITNVFTDDESANSYMLQNENEAVIAVKGKRVYLADKNDTGYPLT
tara:strand:+ start:1032 stop:1355 length:324 start_codon:yes stop_codon:yes gene_type:complete